MRIMRCCLALLTFSLPGALLAQEIVDNDRSALQSKEWVRPQTTHYYLHGPLSERLIVCWREGKVTVGEVRHEHDWMKTFYYRDETTPQAYGLWLVHGTDDAPFDFRQAMIRTEADATPIRGQSWRLGDMEVDLEACSPFGRKPSANLRLRILNHGITPFKHQFAVLLRSSDERKLVFSAPDLYDSYAPRMEQWLDLPSTWKPDENRQWRDGTRFLRIGAGVDLNWDAMLGCVRFDAQVLPGGCVEVDMVLGEGEPRAVNYEAAQVRTRNEWQNELSRVKNRLPLIRRMTVEMLQCFSRPVGKECMLPRQGCLQRWVWPGDQQHVSIALGMLGYCEYVEGALDFYFDEYLTPNGEIGPFGNNWACDTACILNMFARYCLETNNKEYWSKRRALAHRAYEWICAKRRESMGAAGCAEGLFPPMKASDAGGVFQAWGTTDCINLQAVENYASALERFESADAAKVRAEANDYRAVINHFLDHWREESEGCGTFRIPIDPMDRVDTVLRKRNYFYGYHARFAELGFLDKSELIRVRNWLIQEGYANECGLYMHQPTWRCWDTLNWVPYRVAKNVWYTTNSELGWFKAWRRVGRDDLARSALDACLRYAVTEEGCVGERFCTKDPWYFPWSPNASGAGRIVQMMLDGGHDEIFQSNPATNK